MNYKVLITTSGIGSRLGEITKYTNKALVRVGKKPALSYIIEAYPKNIELVITVGYLSNQIKEFVSLAYSDRKITFVEVDKYEGPGSSLGYSILQAKEYLQCPFIFHACDSIVTEIIPEPDRNWAAGFLVEKAMGQNLPLAQYRTHKVDSGKIIKFLDKGQPDFQSIHIGLDGIKDYQMFWEILENLYKNNYSDQSLSEVHVLDLMLNKSASFDWVPYNAWFDTGNSESLLRTREYFQDDLTVLDKLGEAMYIFDDFVIKFYADSDIAAQRVARAKLLKGLVPPFEGNTRNFYRYKYIKGDLYARVAGPTDFYQFLRWAQANIWKPVTGVDGKKFEQACYDFYYTKTNTRVKKFLDTRSIKDGTTIINGERIPALQELVEMIDFRALCKTPPMRFHGDFILDNILKTNDGYCLLDWRQNFGGLLESGDQYYDFAKLNHNLVINHDVIDKNLFTVEIHDNIVTCDIMRPHRLVGCQGVFMDFLAQNEYDIERVKLLTAIVWLNMSPLHHHPFDLFLFYFGKLNLWKTLNQ